MAEQAPIVETRRVVIEYEIKAPLSPPPPARQQQPDITQAVLEVLRRVGFSRASV